MGKTSAADAALERVRGICMALPATEERLSHGSPCFHVRGKLYVSFVDQHHDDGRLAVWCKATFEEQRRLVAESATRFFVPPYVGVKGWVGVRLDQPDTDWVGLAMIAEEGWRSVAPARVLQGKWEPSGPPKPPPVRKTTDAKVAREARARVDALALALPDVTCEAEGQHSTYRAGKKTFAYFLDNHHGDGVVAVCVKAGKPEAAALVKKQPDRFYKPAYIGGMGYVGVKLDGKRVDWKDVAARLAESHAQATARPKAKKATNAKTTKKRAARR